MMSNILRTFMMVVAGVVVFSSCKTKKNLVKTPEKPVVTEPAKAEVKETEPSPEVQSADNTVTTGEGEKNLSLKFKNIQFEFNSAVLKTASYETLDQISSTMKRAPEALFLIGGHSSAEGSPEHNKKLSEDRANSVKQYLVNAGINSSRLSTVGYGEDQPLTSNNSEAGRMLNRRVEIKKTN